MRRLRQRLRQLEQKSGSQVDNRPLLALSRDYDDVDLWHHKRAGSSYRSDELDELRESHRLILISWANSWPPGEQPPEDDNHIRLRWPEDG